MNNITEQLKEILGGVKDAASESNWAQGFDDCVSMREPASSVGQYAEGFQYAYELGEKQSAEFG